MRLMGKSVSGFIFLQKVTFYKNRWIFFFKYRIFKRYSTCYNTFFVFLYLFYDTWSSRLKTNHFEKFLKMEKVSTWSWGRKVKANREIWSTRVHSINFAQVIRWWEEKPKSSENTHASCEWRSFLDLLCEDLKNP